MTNFTNPYPNVPGKMTRLNADIHTADYFYVKGVCPQKGGIQTTINLLWKALVTALERNNIRDYHDQSRYEYLLTNCEIVLGRGCVGGANGQTEKRDERSGVESIRRGGEGTESRPSDVKGKDVKRRKARGTSNTANVGD